MSRRVWVLPFAALVIVGLCGWKVSQPRQARGAPKNANDARLPAPAFVLRDQGKDLGDNRTEPSKAVRLKSFLGRHRVVLVFFDPVAGADHDESLVALWDKADEIKRRDVKVLGVSTAIPQQNRQAIRRRRAGDCPFPLLSDLDGTVCQQWGVLQVLDTGAFHNRSAVFVIDRAGNVGWKDGVPRAEADVSGLMDAVLSGD